MVYGGAGVTFLVFLTSALNADEWEHSISNCFTIGQTVGSTYLLVDCDKCG